MNGTPASNVSSDEKDVYLKYAPAYINAMYMSIGWLVIGAVGNPLSLMVWISPRVRKENSSAIYLAALSVADLCLLVCTVLVHLHYMFEVTAVWYHPVICELYNIPYMAAQYMSPLLVLAFTVERWIAICFPFRRDTLCTTHRACLAVGGLALITLAVSGVNGFFFTYANGECTMRQEQVNVQRYYSMAIELMMSGCVPVLTLVFNILVIRELRRIESRTKARPSVPLVDRSSQAKPLGDGGGSRGGSGCSGGGGGGGGDGTNFKATTAMLLSVSFFLIFTTLPAGLVYTLQFVIPPGDPAMGANMGSDPTWRRFFALVSAKAVIDQLTLSHYACNFFIYLLTGKVFRRHLARQLSQLRLVRLVCRLCCLRTSLLDDSTLNYSQIRHSLHSEHPLVRGAASGPLLGNGSAGVGAGGARPSNAGPLGVRANRRTSARSSSSNATAVTGLGLNGNNAHTYGDTLHTPELPL